MICQYIAKATEWNCISYSPDYAKVVAPFSYELDGQAIVLYIKKLTGNTFLISDMGETAGLLGSHALTTM